VRTGRPELSGTPRITRSDEVAYLADLLDDGEARHFQHEVSFGILVASHHHESLRVRTNILVFATRKGYEVRAAFVFALAEVGRSPTVGAELVRLRLEMFVRVPKGDRCLHGSRN
jgi:hypothetical protein